MPKLQDKVAQCAAAIGECRGGLAEEEGSSAELHHLAGLWRSAEVDLAAGCLAHGERKGKEVAPAVVPVSHPLGAVPVLREPSHEGLCGAFGRLYEHGPILAALQHGKRGARHAGVAYCRPICGTLYPPHRPAVSSRLGLREPFSQRGEYPALEFGERQSFDILGQASAKDADRERAGECA